MADMNPIDTALLATARLADCIDNGVERVSNNAIDAVDTSVDQLGDKLLCNVHSRSLVFE